MTWPRRNLALVLAALFLWGCYESQVYHWKWRRFCRTCGWEERGETSRFFGFDGPRIPGAANREESSPSLAWIEWFADVPHEHTWGVFSGPRMRTGLLWAYQ